MCPLHGEHTRGLAPSVGALFQRDFECPPSPPNRARSTRSPLANWFVGGDWWAFWPLVAWGLVLGVHYLMVKSKRVNDRWVEERTEDVRSKSYDRAHIDSIQTRYSGPEKK